MNLYRTRWYAVLCLFCLIFIFSKRFRSLFYRQAGRLNACRKWKVSLLLFLITLAAGLLMIYPGKSWGGDYSQYYAQARALVTGTIPEWFRKNRLGCIPVDVVNHAGPCLYDFPWLSGNCC